MDNYLIDNWVIEVINIFTTLANYNFVNYQLNNYPLIYIHENIITLSKAI
jgi:hypothetical protein